MIEPIYYKYIYPLKLKENIKKMPFSQKFTFSLMLGSIIGVGLILLSIFSVGYQITKDEAYYNASINDYNVSTKVIIPKEYQQEFIENQKKFQNNTWVYYDYDRNILTLLKAGEKHDSTIH